MTQPLVPQTGGYLGSRKQVGVTDLPSPRGAGLWVVRFTPRDLYPAPVECYHAVVTGPGGNFWLYLDEQLYSVADRGDINEWDPNAPMYVRPGQSIFLYWSVATTPAPVVTLFFREPGGMLR